MTTICISPWPGPTGPCDTVTEADRVALREAVQDDVGDVDPFRLLLGQAREVTYGIELDVDPAADA